MEVKDSSVVRYPIQSGADGVMVALLKSFPRTIGSAKSVLSLQREYDSSASQVNNRRCALFDVRSRRKHSSARKTDYPMQQHTKRDRTSRPSPLSQQRWRWGIRLDRSCEQNSGDRQPPRTTGQRKDPNAERDTGCPFHFQPQTLQHFPRQTRAGGLQHLFKPTWLSASLLLLLPDFSFDATSVDSIGPLQFKLSVHSGPRPSPVLVPV